MRYLFNALLASVSTLAAGQAYAVSFECTAGTTEDSFKLKTTTRIAGGMYIPLLQATLWRNGVEIANIAEKSSGFTEYFDVYTIPNSRALEPAWLHLEQGDGFRKPKYLYFLNERIPNLNCREVKSTPVSVRCDSWDAKSEYAVIVDGSKNDSGSVTARLYGVYRAGGTNDKLLGTATIQSASSDRIVIDNLNEIAREQGINDVYLTINPETGVTKPVDLVVNGKPIFRTMCDQW
jgi:hypothetical protein